MIWQMTSGGERVPSLVQQKVWFHHRCFIVLMDNIDWYLYNRSYKKSRTAVWDFIEFYFSSNSFSETENLETRHSASLYVMVWSPQSWLEHTQNFIISFSPPSHIPCACVSHQCRNWTFFTMNTWVSFTANPTGCKTFTWTIFMWWLCFLQGLKNVFLLCKDQSTSVQAESPTHRWARSYWQRDMLDIYKSKPDSKSTAYSAPLIDWSYLAGCLADWQTQWVFSKNQECVSVWKCL